MGEWFFILWVVLFAAILYGAFTRRGRNFAIKTEYGGKVIEDLGPISEYPIFAGHQKIRLLKCDNNGEQFYVLEADTTMPASKQYYWIRIDKESLQKLNGLIGK